MEVFPFSDVAGETHTREGQGFESCTHLKHGDISTSKTFFLFLIIPFKARMKRIMKG